MADDAILPAASGSGRLSGGRDPFNLVVLEGEEIFRIASAESAECLTKLSQHFNEFPDDFGVVPYDRLTDGDSHAIVSAHGSLTSEQSVVFRVRQCYPFVYGDELPSGELLSMARAVLRLRLWLLERGLELRDADPDNFQWFEGRWVLTDLGSVGFWTGDLIWPALQQFFELFMNPVLMASATGLPTARLLESRLRRGIDAGPTRRTLRGAKRFNAGLLLLHSGTKPGAASKKSREISAINQSMREAGARTGMKIARSQAARCNRILDSCERDLAGASTAFGSYHRREHYQSSQIDRKAFMIGEWCKRLPLEGRLVDLGGNDGRFIPEWLRSRAVLVDVDDAALTNAKSSSDFGHRVLANMSHLCDTIGFGSLERESLCDRLKADAVLVNAVLHHLVISQGRSFEDMAQLLSRFGPLALVEFVNENDPKVLELQRRTNFKARNYSEEQFQEVFGSKFELHCIGHVTETRPIYQLERKD